MFCRQHIHPTPRWSCHHQPNSRPEHLKMRMHCMPPWFSQPNYQNPTWSSHHQPNSQPEHYKMRMNTMPSCLYFKQKSVWETLIFPHKTCDIHDYCDSFLTLRQITFINCDIHDCVDVFFNHAQSLSTCICS